MASPLAGAPSTMAASGRSKTSVDGWRARRSLYCAKLPGADLACARILPVLIGSTGMAQELFIPAPTRPYFAGWLWRPGSCSERAMNAQAYPGDARIGAVPLLWRRVGVRYEIAGYLPSAVGCRSRLDALLNAEVLAVGPSPELVELVELASEPETQSQLLGAYSSCSSPPRPIKAAKIDPSTPLIAWWVSTKSPLVSRNLE